MKRGDVIVFVVPECGLVFDAAGEALVLLECSLPNPAAGREIRRKNRENGSKPRRERKCRDKMAARAYHTNKKGEMHGQSKRLTRPASRP